MSSLNYLAQYSAISLSSGPMAVRGGGVNSSDTGTDLIGAELVSLCGVEHGYTSCSLVLSIVEH